MASGADLSPHERTAALQSMAAEGVDVLVIGGGITGAGVALDAASRGFRVALVEQADFAGGTSSRSTKLVHGGIRYLPQFDFALVREALIERARLAKNAPHLVRPLAFLIPFYRGLTRPLGIRLPAAARPMLPLAMNMGLWLYDLLAGERVLIRHRRVSIAEATYLFPQLRREGLLRASLYYDAQTDDARLTLAVLRTARRYGARCVNYARVVGRARASGQGAGGQGASGQGAGGQAQAGWVVREPVSELEIEDRLGGGRFRVRARYVVNAAGLWAGELARQLGAPGSLRLTLSKGVHLVLPKELLGVGDTALVLPQTDDGRLAFVVPWEGRAILGTTDTAYSGPVEEPPVGDDDVAYLLDLANRYLDVDLTPGDLAGAYAGLRPLASAEGRSADISRSHAVVEHEPGFISIVGGKLTTYRQMAQDALDVIAREETGASRRRAAAGAGAPGGPRPCTTERLTLVGGEEPESWPRLVREAMELGLAPELTLRLLRRYGSELHRLLDGIRRDPSLAEPLWPGMPYIGAEVVFACEATMAVSLEDMMLRRLRMAVADQRAADAAAEAVSRIMARELDWPEVRRVEELERYRRAGTARAAAGTGSTGVGATPR